MKRLHFLLLVVFVVVGCEKTSPQSEEVASVRAMISQYNASTATTSRAFVDGGRLILKAIKRIPIQAERIAALRELCHAYSSREVWHWPYSDRERLSPEYWQPVYDLGYLSIENGASEDEVWALVSTCWKAYRRLCISACEQSVDDSSGDDRLRQHCARLLVADYVNYLGLFERSMIKVMFGDARRNEAERFLSRWQDEFGTYAAAKRWKNELSRSWTVLRGEKGEWRHSSKSGIICEIGPLLRDGVH